MSAGTNIPYMSPRALCIMLDLSPLEVVSSSLAVFFRYIRTNCAGLTSAIFYCFYQNTWTNEYYTMILQYHSFSGIGSSAVHDGHPPPSLQKEGLLTLNSSQGVEYQ